MDAVKMRSVPSSVLDFVSAARPRPLCGLRLFMRHRAAAVLSAEITDTQRHTVVRTVPPRRLAAPPPEPVAVTPSPAFLLRHRQTVQPSTSTRRSAAVHEEDGNPVRRVLQRVDRSLDELEADAPPLVEAVWAVSNSPIAHAAGRGVTVAAKVGREAALLAVPVGKWALQRGFSLAVGAIAAGGRSSSRSRSTRESRSPRKLTDKSADD